LPQVKDKHHFLELFVPRLYLFLEDFVVGTHLHTGNIGDVFIDSGPEVFPASDQLALLFEPGKLQFSGFPGFFTAV
jgi:hypothetical protein